MEKKNKKRTKKMGTDKKAVNKRAGRMNRCSFESIIL
jgi:hypothetical protein